MSDNFFQEINLKSKKKPFLILGILGVIAGTAMLGVNIAGICVGSFIPYSCVGIVGGIFVSIFGYKYYMHHMQFT